nr:MAG TPA_asm: hypothetical protein [Bacteriophage sp.]
MPLIYSSTRSSILVSVATRLSSSVDTPLYSGTYLSINDCSAGLFCGCSGASLDSTDVDGSGFTTIDYEGVLFFSSPNASSTFCFAYVLPSSAASMSSFVRPPSFKNSL